MCATWTGGRHGEGGSVVDTFGHIFVDVGCAIVGFMSQAQTTVPKMPTGEHNHA